MAELTVAVDIPLVGDERRRNWAKVVRAVDESKATGWAFEGDFISAGGVQDVPAGAVVLVYGERGSVSNPQIEARAYVANADGTLSAHGQAKGKAWARTIRDLVAELLDDQSARDVTERDWHPDLMLYTESALREELRRRRVSD